MIFPLLPEELIYLINDEKVTHSLKLRMREVKDFFVFDCTVALGFSDLLAFTKSNTLLLNRQQYLAVRSIKTGTDTLIRLPPHAIEIINRYKGKKLLPRFNVVNLNKFIKRLLEQAGFLQPDQWFRCRRGVAVMQKGENKTELRFCDVATTHTMRRTAITTMLSLGIPELVVRKISGHSPGGKEFFRYVSWAQKYQDAATDQMFETLAHKKLVRVEKV